MIEKKIKEAQKACAKIGADGWLLYDFHGNNELARHFLGLGSHQMTTRRFFYWIPVKGKPVKIVHAIEAGVLDHFPGTKSSYSSWQSLELAVKKALKGAKRVAMEYSPKNAIPYVSRVDGGTVDLVRSFGVEVVSSADFLASFTAVLSKSQIASQRRAGAALDKIAGEIWKWISECLKKKKKITEYDVQQKILRLFKERDLITDHAPIVGVNANSADPHFEPEEKGSKVIKKGDFVLIDLWAKEKGEEAVFGDITRVAVADSKPSAKQKEIFEIVRRAQKTAVALVKSRFSAKKRLEGWEVDAAARKVISDAGYGEFFIHRTGHNIEIALHGSGANMDNLEMHDVRPILAGTCFSVEPGIYLPGKFGVRLELDVLVDTDGSVSVTGGEQDEIVCLLSK